MRGAVEIFVWGGAGGWGGGHKRVGRMGGSVNYNVDKWVSGDVGEYVLVNERIWMTYEQEQ